MEARRMSSPSTGGGRSGSGNSAKNGRFRLIILMITLFLAGLGGVAVALEKAHAARRETAGLREAISGVKDQIEHLRKYVSEAEDRAAASRAGINARLDRVLGLR
jgi:hypothetical protein